MIFNCGIVLDMSRASVVTPVLKKGKIKSNAVHVGQSRFHQTCKLQELIANDEITEVCPAPEN